MNPFLSHHWGCWERRCSRWPPGRGRFSLRGAGSCPGPTDAGPRRWSPSWTADCRGWSSRPPSSCHSLLRSCRTQPTSASAGTSFNAIVQVQSRMERHAVWKAHILCHSTANSGVRRAVCTKVSAPIVKKEVCYAVSPVWKHLHLPDCLYYH